MHALPLMALAFAFSWACSDDGSAGDSGGSGGQGGSGGGGGGTAGEYLDAAGTCRRDFEAGMFGCPASYAEALASESPCGSACAGPSADLLLYLRDCTPAVRCAYDAGTLELVGAFYGDDVPSHCGESSLDVVSGRWPGDVALNAYDLDEQCGPLEVRSPSPLFDEVFGEKDPIEVGQPCRSGLDQCRGTVRLFVCARDSGVVAGDGSCARCESDEQCRSEYRYLGEDIVCRASGDCGFSEFPVGACDSDSSAACTTAAAAYVCDEGICARCSSAEQCERVPPAYNVCIGGVCMRSEPLP